MGKPTSCFKIITCGGDSKDHVDIDDVPEDKASGEKRGWSFRKRSARQRVLSNSVITETPPSEFKDSFETAGLDFQQTANSIVAEKQFVTDCVNEKLQRSCPENAKPKPSEVVVSTHDENKDDDQMEESIATVIQTAIRRLLGQMALTKLKNVVKLQAAVRGHVVRRHAVGTLRCIQAIVKMQALVRARSSLQSSGGSNRDSSDQKDEHDLNKLKTRENKEVDKSKVMYISMEKLLSNRFAQQLLDSTPKTTSINIKCDSLKSDSAWKWLERWMSVSSVDIVEQNRAEMIAENGGNEKEENVVSQLDNGIDSEVFNSDNAIFIDKESTLSPVGEADLITCEDKSLEVQACEGTASSSREIEEMKDMSMEAETGNSSSDQMAQSVVYPQLQFDYNPEKKVAENDQPIMKGVLSELEKDCRKSVVGSRKATNPAFIAAQSRFEVLSSTANSGKSISLSLEENMESRVQTISSLAETAVETKELDSSERVSLPGSRVISCGGSECGTELSISSTLDSPDRCDSGNFELEHNGNVLAEDIPDSDRSKNADDEEVDVTPAILSSNLSQPILDEPKKSDLVICESIISGASSDPGMIEVKAERNIFHQLTEVDSETSNQACRSSPEVSPKSHITVPESQGTPSSQLSVKANKNKVDNSGSSLKRKSLSARKKSHSNNTHNSGSRSSPDHSAKDQKNGKRRNSFGSARPDNVELESRDSTSNNSLPRFMQATESARAKLNSNNSPRSSPDIQDRDIYIKKRHSLSGTNGRQGSPCIQRTMSQAKQSAKGNESKWQR